MANSTALPEELWSEILTQLDLDDVISVSQTSSSFRTLILSEKRILTKAWHTYPFPLPIGTTARDPPSNFYFLCMRALRLRDRLSQADVTTALKPKRLLTALDIPRPHNSGVARTSAPRDLFIFGDIVIYSFGRFNNSLMLIDLTDKANRSRLPLEGEVVNLFSQMLDDNCTIRTATVIQTAGNRLSIDEFSVTAEDFGRGRHIRDVALPETIQEETDDEVSIHDIVLLDGNLAFATGLADFVIYDCETGTGIHVQLESISVRLQSELPFFQNNQWDMQCYRRLCVHPNRESVIVFYDSMDDLEHTYISLIPIPPLHPIIVVPEESGDDVFEDARWETISVAPAPLLSYPSRGGSSSTSHRFYHRSSLASHVIDIIRERRGYDTNGSDHQHLLCSTPSLSLCTAHLSKLLPPATTHLLNIRSIPQAWPFRDAQTGVGASEEDGIYILMKGQENMPWIKLDIRQAFPRKIQSRRGFHFHIWGFDMSEGKLVIFLEDRLYVLYY
ncbi:hypothetical protein SISNIDRAFT_490658 [Sistotremastrum niveocremeum HHB9708]|uniref:F-box domain-containing protein n=1 Tax=Sistotremastrum niveocremeum HHB9708 TaxID=1314777 RepID=A0A164NML6_9AGAM|nr:hypothetical protein SISNIDRAFT_490658 [Sistotremastrum niveocremeum HHB9708]